MRSGPASTNIVTVMMQLTAGQSLAVISLAAWLMVRAGTSKKRLEVRGRPRCASCGRRLSGAICSCTRQ
jgi:hypothetical protein